jgi:ribosome-associated protein
MHEAPRGSEAVAGLRVAPGVVIPGAALRLSFVGSSGPGGQNVNKRATRAVLRVRVRDLPIPDDAGARLRTLGARYLTAGDELVIAADEHRSRERNRAGALARLADLVRRSLVRPRTRRATRPTRASRERRLVAKRRRAEIKRERRHGAE